MLRCRNILLNCILVLSFILSFVTLLFAEEKIDFKDKLVAVTFKALAKAFVATADLDSLKRDNIAKINKMNEAKFKKKFTEIYAVIKELPASIRIEYGISENMPKGQVVNKVESLNKSYIYRFIDRIPDEFIAVQFKGYLSRAGKDICQNNLASQVNVVWEKIIAKTKHSKLQNHPL